MNQMNKTPKKSHWTLPTVEHRKEENKYLEAIYDEKSENLSVVGRWYLTRLLREISFVRSGAFNNKPCLQRVKNSCFHLQHRAVSGNLNLTMHFGYFLEYICEPSRFLIPYFFWSPEFFFLFIILKINNENLLTITYFLMGIWLIWENIEIYLAHGCRLNLFNNGIIENLKLFVVSEN